MSNTESINNHLRHLEYLGRFHALTEMFAESSALVLKEQEAHDGAYGRRADSRSRIIGPCSHPPSLVRFPSFRVSRRTAK